MTAKPKRTGVLLLQLGTPDSTEVSDVRRYLREFLGDRRVLDMPAAARWLLLNAIILPFRPRKSAEAYRKIWTKEGSPLILHTDALAAKVSERLGDGFEVVVGMRYQNPSLASAVDKLVAAGVDRVVVFPLFPQYASASTGSAVEHALEVIGQKWNVPEVETVGAFYDIPGYLDSVADVARPHIQQFEPEHILFSYHGLPEKQIRKSDPSGEWCLESADCCATISEVNRFCYRAQCFATTRGLSERLDLADDSFSTTFQSRLAGQKWIEPYTDKVLPDLYQRGIRRIAVLTPSFVADCLETIEEIGIRGREQWSGLGGEDFLLVPCVNSDDSFADAMTGLIRH